MKTSSQIDQEIVIRSVPKVENIMCHYVRMCFVFESDKRNEKEMCVCLFQLITTVQWVDLNE